MKRDEALALMRSKMTTYEEAIKKLNDAGLRATERTWSMGRTIAILSPVGQTTIDGVTSSPLGGYLYPIEYSNDTEWGLMDGLSYTPVARFDALVLAVRGAIIWFTGLEVIYLGKTRKYVL